MRLASGGSDRRVLAAFLRVHVALPLRTTSSEFRQQLMQAVL